MKSKFPFAICVAALGHCIFAVADASGAEALSVGEKAMIMTACSALSADFAYDLDFPDGRKLSELFAPDGVWELRKFPPMVGRDAIRAFWDKTASEQKPGVKIRHLLTNVRVEIVDRSHARGTAYVTIYTVNPTDLQNGKPLTPASINVVSDEYAVSKNGCLFHSRRPAME